MPADEDPLQQGQRSYERLAWGFADTLLSRADARAPLAAADLERLAVAAYLTGRQDDAADALDRAHRGWLDQGAIADAVRCAFWLGVILMQGGQPARAGGWVGGSRVGRAC